MIRVSARLALNSLSVVSPSIASNRWAARWASLRHWAWFSASVPRPISTMKIGINGAETTRMIADTQSVGTTKARIASGMKATRTRCGR